MKKNFIRIATICALAAMIPMTSCIGSFQLTNKMLNWNRNIGNKFLNELVFVAFWILPVYEVSAIADIIVLNSIEFWSGSNPVAKGTRVIEGHDGRYLVYCDGKGYTITNPDGTKTRLDFDFETREWSTVIGGESVVIFAYVDDTHVRLPLPDGTDGIFEISADGLYAYESAVAAPLPLMARR